MCECKYNRFFELLIEHIIPPYDIIKKKYSIIFIMTSEKIFGCNFDIK